LEYTVNVTKSGTYDIVLRASTDGDGKTISLSADGVSLANDVAVTNTAGWQEWTDVIVENVQLQAGEQVLKLTIGTVDYVNLNNITFTLQGDPVTIQLKTGWNLIGYPFTTSTTIEDALSSISENLLFVKDNDGYYDANSTPTLNSLIELQYGKGYYVKVDADCELEW
jgi:hypothetical protein